MDGQSFSYWFVGFFSTNGGSDAKESGCNVGDLGSIPVGKIPWRREWLPVPVFLPGEVHGAQWSTVHWVAISQTWLKRLSTQSKHKSFSTHILIDNSSNFTHNVPNLEFLICQFLMNRSA